MNKPNILSNELDQAPKTAEAGYEVRLQDPHLSQEIKEAFDAPYFHGDNAVIDWIAEHYQQLPLESILNLAPGQLLSIELKREKKDPRPWSREKATGALISAEEASNRIGGVIQRKGMKSVTPWDISTYLICSRQFPKEHMEEKRDFSLKLAQVEIPNKNALVMPGIVFYNEPKEEVAKTVLSKIYLKS